MSVVVSTSARPRAGTVNLLAAGVLWGTGGIAGSALAAATGLSSLSVAACRLVLGGLFTVAALGVLGRLRGVPRTSAAARRVFVTGALLALFQACYFASVAATSVGIATMATIGSVPVFVAGATAVRQRRLPDVGTSLCVAGAVTGLVLLTWSPEGTADRGRFVAGLVAALVSGAGFATLTLATRTRVAGLDPVRTTGFGCLLGGVLLLPVAVWSGLSIPLHWDVLAVACYLGAVPTALAYAAYSSSAERCPGALWCVGCNHSALGVQTVGLRQCRRVFSTRRCCTGTTVTGTRSRLWPGATPRT